MKIAHKSNDKKGEKNKKTLTEIDKEIEVM
jgi:hypothetical protein